MFFQYCTSRKILFAHQSPNYFLHRSCAPKIIPLLRYAWVNTFECVQYNKYAIKFMWQIQFQYCVTMNEYIYYMVIFWWACIWMIYYVKVFSTCLVIAIKQLFGWTSLFISRRLSLFLFFISCNTHFFQKHFC